MFLRRLPSSPRFRRALLAGLALLAAVPVSAQAPAPQARPVAAGTPAAGQIPGAEAMAAHRAAYRLTLDKVRENGDVAQVQGAMLFEVLDACDGWTTRQRLTLRIVNRDGQQIETASDYATFEGKDGRSLRFSMTQATQGAVSQRIQGEATLQPDGSGVARYTQPQAKEVTLPPGTLLPMGHTIRAIDAARRSQRLLVAPLMDGTGEDGAQDSTTVISSWDGNGPAQPRFPLLANEPSGRMRIAFFGQDSSGGGAAAPDYEVGLRYYANGVADELKMDFGEFSLDGKLETLEATPTHC
ncbi:cell envelope integrity EipB family protein [Roseomonas sp. OT10]|uniref:cell envelope integrity EipB family protein n=1 Tax=Roseomonas cutis TaxID=2897332 RepID=UPI001E3C16CB|nr:cell envelope integrity EipB family protein [Roseomonas sp. OT10]UFN48752.1 cell envelope integrity EipB family protein [Roseomonas sp. OT10]